MQKFIGIIVTICVIAFVLTNPTLAADLILGLIEAIVYFVQALIRIFQQAPAASIQVFLD